MRRSALPAKPELIVDVGDEIGKRVVNARQILARETTLHRGVGAHPEEHRIEILEQSLEGDVAADLRAELKFDAHALHDFAALLDDLLLELEGRNAERQQAADARVAVKHDGLDAIAHQDVGAARGPQARRRRWPRACPSGARSTCRASSRA